jgi:hypothetical protein
MSQDSNIDEVKHDEAANKVCGGSLSELRCDDGIQDGPRSFGLSVAGWKTNKLTAPLPSSRSSEYL